MLIVPVRDFTFLHGMPAWFQWCFAAIYITAFTIMLGTFAYVIWQIAT